MPIITSSYAPPHLYKNSHFSTIYPNLFRKITGVIQQRERIELADGDFIDIDWSTANDTNTDRLTIIIHGLEGNAQRQYMLGAIKHLNDNHWNVAAINLRNCSEEENRLYRSYHGGASDDLDIIIKHIITNYPYTDITLSGFSLGGNIMLKYLGENRVIPSQIKAATGISVPCDLYNSLSAINKPANFIYKKRFIRHLKKKLYEKQKAFPDKIRIADIKKCTTLIAIDDLYTSKAHGFVNAMDYYKKNSCLQFLETISIPTLIINAQNDSFLGTTCYPKKEAENNTNLFLEIPKHGGHVGFYLPNNIYYHEHRITSFFNQHANIQ